MSCIHNYVHDGVIFCKPGLESSSVQQWQDQSLPDESDKQNVGKSPAKCNIKSGDDSTNSSMTQQDVLEDRQLCHNPIPLCRPKPCLHTADEYLQQSAEVKMLVEVVLQHQSQNNSGEFILVMQLSEKMCLVSFLDYYCEYNTA